MSAQRHLLFGLAIFFSASLAGCQTWSKITNASIFGGNSDDPTEGEDLKQPVKTSLAAAVYQEHIGDLKNAKKWYGKALKHDKNSVEATLGLARVEMRMKNDVAAKQHFAAATELLQASLKKDPTNRDHRYHLAIALTRAGKTSEAYSHFVQALRDPAKPMSAAEAAAHYNLGYLAQESGNVADAARHYQLALAKDPNQPQARAMLAKLNGPAGGANVQLAGGQKPPRTQSPNARPKPRRVWHYPPRNNTQPAVNSRPPQPTGGETGWNRRRSSGRPTIEDWPKP